MKITYSSEDYFVIISSPSKENMFRVIDLKNRKITSSYASLHDIFYGKVMFDKLSRVRIKNIEVWMENFQEKLILYNDIQRYKEDFAEVFI